MTSESEVSAEFLQHGIAFAGDDVGAADFVEPAFFVADGDEGGLLEVAFFAEFAEFGGGELAFGLVAFEEGEEIVEGLGGAGSGRGGG